MFPVPRQAGIKMLATPEDAIRALPHEVLVIHGRDDQIIPLASSVRLHSLLRHSDLHVFGECGHWTQIERKDRFASMVSDFFSR
jgi:2-hydroxymuconate-semialdehyde hydrolase